MRRRDPDPGSDPIDRRHVRPPRRPAEIAAEAALVVPHTAGLVWRLLGRDDVPMRAKVLVGFAVAYVLSAIDLIPDRIPVIGYVDDVLVTAVAVDRLLSSVDRSVVEASWDGSEDALDLVRSFVAWGSDLATSVAAGRLPNPTAR